MNGKVLIVAVALVAMGGVNAAWAQQAREFIGLWEGVDPDDGSLSQRAITCETRRSCEVLGADQFFSLCTTNDPITNGRGILAGTGGIQNGVLFVPNFQLTCNDGTTSPEFQTTYTPDRPNGTLIEEAEGGPSPIVLHRVSPKIRW